MTGYIVPILLFATLGTIALLHAHWARGGVWPASDAQHLSAIVVGDPRAPGMPPPRLAWLVAGVIAIAALDGLALGFRVNGWVDALATWIGVGLTGVFACRGVAGYTPFWREAHPDPAFALLDRGFYSPLCILIAEGFFTQVSGRL